MKRALSVIFGAILAIIFACTVYDFVEFCKEFDEDLAGKGAQNNPRIRSPTWLTKLR